MPSDRSHPAPAEIVTGYCFRCRTMKEMKDATEIRMRNGKPALHGSCVTCGTPLFRIAKPAAPAR